MFKLLGRVVPNDKYREVKPAVSLKMKETLLRISSITHTSLNEVAIEICESGVVSKKVIDEMSPHFQHSIWLDQTLYRGSQTCPSILNTMIAKPKGRIALQFSEISFENIRKLSYALEVTPSTATEVLLDISLKNGEFINDYVRHFFNKHAHKKRVHELKHTFKLTNASSPYEEELSKQVLLSYIFDETAAGSEHNIGL
ncbi:hypothetical protein ABEV54_15785 [Peribacillus psychrosaccharolyticus]|uniref:hypothetical protein n=1 Tax=Peribacillus psychrosaccharolyticus TaxID=1407 RepID=UPI003D272BEA